jgi:hypothetical protein
MSERGERHTREFRILRRMTTAMSLLAYGIGLWAPILAVWYILLGAPNLSIFLILLSLIVGGIGLKRCSFHIRCVAGALLISSLLVFCTPFDISIRRSSDLSLKIMPVIHVSNSYKALRNAQNQGRIENVHFVVYHRKNSLVGIRSALVLFVPF